MRRGCYLFTPRLLTLALLATSGVLSMNCSLDKPPTDRCSRDADCLSGRVCVDGRCSDHRNGEGGDFGTGGSIVGGGGGGALVSADPEGGGGAGRLDEHHGQRAGATAGADGVPVDCGGYMLELPTGYCIDWREIQRIEYYENYLANPIPVAIPGCEENETLEPGCEWPGFDEALEARAVGSDAYDYWAISRPATCVDWCDAAAYCAVRDQHLCGGPYGQAVPFDDFADPMKSLWSVACTQGGTSEYPYGDTLVPGRCIDGTSNGGTRTEGTDRQSSCKGAASIYACLSDLSGNAAEWEDSCDGTGENANCRVRGGSYLDTGADVSCSADSVRARLDSADPSVGFRCCKSQCKP